jgi:hypothetical protein
MFGPYVNITTTPIMGYYSKITISNNYQKLNVDPSKAGINVAMPEVRILGAFPPASKSRKIKCPESHNGTQDRTQTEKDISITPVLH